MSKESSPMDVQPSASADNAGSGTLPPRDDIAGASENVFISLNSTVEEIRKLVVAKEQITFVRAPVAARKTTLAHYLASIFPEEFVMVKTGRTEEQWLKNLKNAYVGKEPAEDTEQSVMAIQAQNKALVIDEAHLLFGCPGVYSDLIKLWLPKVKILLFSAAATGKASDGSIVATPPEIYKKYIWYPPIPDGNDLALQLEDADIFLDGAAVDFLMKICCGHRGIFMMATLWVEERQKKEGQDMLNSQNKCDVNKCVTEVRYSFEESEKLKRRNRGNGWDSGLKEQMANCQAIRVNGMYSELNNIPKEFVNVVFGGSREKNELNGKERELTIAGFLVPERDSAGEEFVLYNWNRETARPFGASLTIYDVVVENVVIRDGRPRTSLSPQLMPYEDHYNDALAKVFEDLGYSVSWPLSAEGKVDLIVSFEDGNSNIKNCALETIMAPHSLAAHNEHALPFAKPNAPNYSSAHFKTLLTIGSDGDTVKGHVERINHVAGVEVVGLVVSQAHDSYSIKCLSGNRGK